MGANPLIVKLQIKTSRAANDQSDHLDLDSCLAAADEVGEQLFAPAFAAIRAANEGV